MDKGPHGTIKKFPARKNNDFMIKVLTRRSRNQKRVYKSDSIGMATKPAWIKGHTALSKNILPEKTSIPW